MSFTVVLLVALSALLAILILTKKLRFPLMMEVGMFCVAAGMLAAADALHSDSACTPLALMLRWCLVGGGFGLMLLSVLIKGRKQHGGFRRASDYVDLQHKDMTHVKGGKQ